MPKKEKIKTLFEGIIEQEKIQKDSPQKSPNSTFGIGHVIVNSGGNTINIYNESVKS